MNVVDLFFTDKLIRLIDKTSRTSFIFSLLNIRNLSNVRKLFRLPVYPCLTTWLLHHPHLFFFALHSFSSSASAVFVARSKTRPRLSRKRHFALCVPELLLLLSRRRISSVVDARDANYVEKQREKEREKMGKKMEKKGRKSLRMENWRERTRERDIRIR